MDSRSFFNSPVIPKNTPIKRLGLSRKRKSSDSVGKLNASIQASSEKSFRLDEKTKEASEPEMNNDRTVNQLVDYKKELEVVKTKISEKEEKLKTFQHNNKNILELEDLIKLWKTGCKNAFLELMQVLKDKEPSFTNKDVLNKLGIWETMYKHFEQDSDISLLLDSN